MIELTNKERKLLNALILLRTIFIISGAIGFCIMLYTPCNFNDNTIAFQTCGVYILFSIIIIGSSFAFYNYATKTYDDMCFYLGLYDDISFIKKAKKFEPDLYEEYITNITGHSSYEKPVETSKSNRTLYNIDLRKIYGNETTIPIAESNLKFTPIRNGNLFVKGELSSKNDL